MSSLFIVRVILSQTVDDAYYVYKWLPWSKPPYVIAIYSTSTFMQDSRWLILCICGCNGVTPFMSLLFIVRVLLSQTIDDSSYVYFVSIKYPPSMSSLFIVRCFHLLPTQQWLTIIYRKLCCQRYKGYVRLAQTVLPNNVTVQRSFESVSAFSILLFIILNVFTVFWNSRQRGRCILNGRCIHPFALVLFDFGWLQMLPTLR